MSAVSHAVIAGLPTATPTALTRTFITSASVTTDLTTYTFAALIATAASPRKVVAVLTARAAATAAPTLSSCTLAGVAATCTTMASGGDICVAVAVAAVPEASTGDVVATFSAAMEGAEVAVYDLFNAISNTPTTSGSASSDPFTYSLTCQSGSVVFGGVFDFANSSVTWTGLTENVDATSEIHTYSMASAAFAVPQVNVSVIADLASSSSGRLGVAVFSPL